MNFFTNHWIVWSVICVLVIWILVSSVFIIRYTRNSIPNHNTNAHTEIVATYSVNFALAGLAVAFFITTMIIYWSKNNGHAHASTKHLFTNHWILWSIAGILVLWILAASFFTIRYSQNSVSDHSTNVHSEIIATYSTNFVLSGLVVAMFCVTMLIHLKENGGKNNSGKILSKIQTKRLVSIYGVP